MISCWGMQALITLFQLGHLDGVLTAAQSAAADASQLKQLLGKVRTLAIRGYANLGFLTEESRSHMYRVTTRCCLRQPSSLSAAAQAARAPYCPHQRQD